MFQISRRKFFGLFGGAVAAAASPKPLMAMAPAMVVPESTAGNITYKMLQDAYAQTVRRQGRYVYVQLPATAIEDYRPGRLVYWIDPGQDLVTTDHREASAHNVAGYMMHPPIRAYGGLRCCAWIATGVGT